MKLGKGIVYFVEREKQKQKAQKAPQGIGIWCSKSIKHRF
jgi:hypothetical protein